ncbi:hypothetical protein JHK82_020670 [Glycine max]|nr:hypothetical protein JHK86_020682 [Glycine max]KAG5135939.1 hypothetical protein JHK82_020670 [Glycine max]
MAKNIKTIASGANPFFLLAGPNVIELEEHILRMAKNIKTIASEGICTQTCEGSANNHIWQQDAQVNQLESETTGYDYVDPESSSARKQLKTENTHTSCGLELWKPL